MEGDVQRYRHRAGQCRTHRHTRRQAGLPCVEAPDDKTVLQPKLCAALPRDARIADYNMNCPH
jgi:hypothetical protein